MPWDHARALYTRARSDGSSILDAASSRHGTANEAELLTLNFSEHIGADVYKRVATHRGAHAGPSAYIYIYILALNYLHRLSHPIVDVRRVARLADTVAGGVHGPDNRFALRRL